MTEGRPITPRSICCPRCNAPIGTVCATFVEPDAADDLATRVPLYCAERVDAAFTKLTELLNCVLFTPEQRP